MLAAATFSSIRSANRSARVAERAMLAGQRPILIPSSLSDPPERARFGDRFAIEVEPHGGRLVLHDDRLYMAIGVRNGGAGVAVIHGWHVLPATANQAGASAPPLSAFRRQLRDLYIPGQHAGFWQAAIRDPDDPDYAMVRAAAETGERVLVDLLYGDHEGGQRTIARFAIAPENHPESVELGYARGDVLRYWNVDSDDPR